mmetsp:Transcript_21731/g.63246  ORF Transcript_21731/g.63246 Transcript_21731/m.63246 type:complete len:289 (-) Transcript_21731:1680-2546(-)
MRLSKQHGTEQDELGHTKHNVEMEPKSKHGIPKLEDLLEWPAAREEGHQHGQGEGPTMGCFLACDWRRHGRVVPPPRRRFLGRRKFGVLRWIAQSPGQVSMERRVDDLEALVYERATSVDTIQSREKVLRTVVSENGMQREKCIDFRHGHEQHPPEGVQSLDVATGEDSWLVLSLHLVNGVGVDAIDEAIGIARSAHGRSLERRNKARGPGAGHASNAHRWPPEVTRRGWVRLRLSLPLLGFAMVHREGQSTGGGQLGHGRQKPHERPRCRLLLRTSHGAGSWRLSLG